MEEPFDVGVLHRLIDDALGAREAPPAPPGPQRVPLAFNEGRLLERLATSLGSYVSASTTQAVLDDLRAQLYAGTEMGDLRHLHAIASHCRRCPALHGPERPQGTLVHPGAAIIVDGPANASEALAKHLAAAQFSAGTYVVTYLTRCRPTALRAPEASEVANCRSYLTQELQLLRPRLLVPMGSAATAALIGPAKLAEVHGTMFWCGPWPILPTYSVYYAERAQVLGQLQTDLEKAWRFLYDARPVGSGTTEVLGSAGDS